MNQGNLSRRGFMARALGTMTATGLPLWFAQERLAQAQNAQPRNPGPNDQILVGQIGCGGRGAQIAPLAAAINGVQYVACCDVDRTRSQSFARRMNVNRGRELAQFADFRELLARRDINAVVIATPDHWHALTAIAAMRAGKDVYCEKPLTLTVEEGKAMVRVARETNRILQTGSQQRTEFNGRFRMAVDLVRNDRIGRVETIECRVGNNPRQGPFPTAQPPEGLNWDFWMGPTPRCDYVQRKCHNDFRWWYEYSGGKMTDWGAHHLDTAQWALNMDDSGPIEVERVSATDPWNPDPLSYNCHPAFVAGYRYANGTVVRARNDGENGLQFTGSDGKWLFVSRNAMRASDPAIINEPLPKNAPRVPAHNSQMRNFFDCVRSRQQPLCNVNVGHRSASVCHIGNIAIRLNQRLRWDPAREQFVDNEAANQMLSRPMRAPWRLGMFDA
jgi:predicted dehydrogenase